MTRFIRAHPALSYFALAFAISWTGILLVIHGGPIPAPSEDVKQLFMPVYLAMLAGPSVAGIVLTALTAGTTGLRDYRARLLKWRVAPASYVIALLTAPVALALTAFILTRFSSAFIPAVFASSSGPIDPMGPIRSENLNSFVLTGLAVGLGAGFFEELGWTGFAIPTLLKRHSALWTGVVLGTIWGAWHFLAVFWGSARDFGGSAIPVFLIVALFSFLPPYRVLMVRLYERTGSLLVAILMHASLTASMIILGSSIKGTQSIVFNLTFAAVLWLIAAVMVRVGDLPARARSASNSEQLVHRQFTIVENPFKLTHNQRMNHSAEYSERQRVNDAIVDGGAG